MSLRLRNPMRSAILMLAVAATLGGAASSNAQAQPTTRPLERMQQARERNGPPGSGGAAPVQRTRLPQAWRDATREERDSVLAFVRESLPDLAKRLENAPFGTLARPRLANLGLKRYREVTRAKEEFPEDPSLVESLLKQYRSEDEIFSLVEDYIKAVPAERTKTGLKVREKIGEIVSNAFKERERRLAALEAQVQAERSRLESDKQAVQLTIDQRMKQMVKDVEQLNAGDDKKGEDGDPAPAGNGPTTSTAAPTAQP